MAIDQITTGIIKDDAVTAAKIPAGAVVADIANDSITNAKMADDAIDSAQLAAGAVDTAHLGNLQVTAAKVAADVATVAGTQTLTNKTLTTPTLNSAVMVTPALGTPASGVATNLTSIPAAAVGGVLPVGVTGGSGLLSVPGATQHRLGTATADGTASTISFDLSSYSSTYDSFRFNFENVQFAGDNAGIQMKVGTANTPLGSTYWRGGWRTYTNNSSQSPLTQDRGNDCMVKIGVYAGNVGGESGVVGWCDLYNPFITKYTLALSYNMDFTYSDYVQMYHSWGGHISSAVTPYIFFISTNGNFREGNIVLYGNKNA